MNINTEIILIALARDWYLDAAARYGGETGGKLRDVADGIQKHLNGLIGESKGEKSGDSGQE